MPYKPFVGGACLSGRLRSDDAAVLSDRSPAREGRLLQVSNERFEHAQNHDSNSAEVRLAVFECGYLALAAALHSEEMHPVLHPSMDLVRSSASRVDLMDEDAVLAEELSRLYSLPGWERLDLDTLFDWCSRVRLAVYRHLQGCRTGMSHE